MFFFSSISAFLFVRAIFVTKLLAMNLKTFGFITLMGIVLLACDNSALCLSGQSAIQAGLYSASTGEEKDTTLNGFYLWGLDNPNDSILIDSVSTNKMYMPTNINIDSTFFVVREKNTITDLNDTIKFYYSRELKYISGDCGFTYELNIDTAIHTNNFIDSIVISYPSVIYNENLENVKIFIEP